MSGHRAPRRFADALCLAVASLAILGWLFAEWLIVGLCGGLTTCGPSRSWGGHYVPLQAVIAAAGVWSAVRVILRVLETRPPGRALAALIGSAALWAIVVWVQAHP